MSDYNSSLPVRTQNDGDVVAKISDKTVPSQQLAVNADGSINITDNSGSLTVDAADLDIRDLSHSQDSVKVGDGTDLLAVNADGSINVIFPAGAEIKITDGTDDLAINGDGSINSVVTATDLDIRDLSHSQDSVKVGDGTDFLAVNADGSVNITDNGGSLTVDASNLDIRDLVFATDKVDVSGSTVALDGPSLAALESITVQNGAGASAVNIQDGGNSITVDGSVSVSATDLDIRDLSHSQDSIKIGDGTDFLAVNGDGSINVVMTNDMSGDEVNDYDTSAAIAAAATDNHDYTVTAAKTLLLSQVFASASGKLKIDVQVESGVATNIFATKFVGFNSTASPNILISLPSPISVAAGVRVRVIRTNKDNQSQDVYSTISGQEV